MKIKNHNKHKKQNKKKKDKNTTKWIIEITNQP